MKSYISAFLTFALFWFIAWLGGYNFDTRHAMVAYWFFLSVAASVAVFGAMRSHK